MTARPVSESSRRKGFSALLLGAVCIAFAPIFVRLSELDPTATAFQRMLLALPLFAWWMFIGTDATLGGRRSKPAAVFPEVGNRVLLRQHWRLLLLCGFFFAADLAVWHWSIVYTSVANATLLANLAPVLVTAAAWLWLRESIGPRFLLALLLALSGVYLLMRASAAAGERHLLGDFLGIATAFFYAGYLLTIKQLRRSLPTALLMSGSTLISCAALGLLAWLAGEPLFPVTTRGWLVVLALAWLSQFVGQSLIAYGIAHLPVSFSSLSLLLQPVIAALLAWWLFAEALSGLALFGALCVLLAIAFSRPSRAVNPTP